MAGDAREKVGEAVETAREILDWLGNFSSGKLVPEEPPLACYVTETCPQVRVAQATIRLTVAVKPRTTG